MSISYNHHPPEVIKMWFKEDNEAIKDQIKEKKWVESMLVKYAHNKDKRKKYFNLYNEICETLKTEVEVYKKDYGETYNVLPKETKTVFN